jgi:hypothetical protein
VAWYNQEHLHEALGYQTPAEHEAALTGTSHPASQPTPALATDQEQNLGQFITQQPDLERQASTAHPALATLVGADGIEPPTAGV